MRRSWIVVAASLAVAGLVAWAATAGSGDSARSPEAASPIGSGSTDGTGSSSSGAPRIIGGPAGRTESTAIGFDAAANNVIDRSRKTGGTLRLLAANDCDSWDPARTSLGWCWNMQRLITRTLVGYRSVNGTDFKLGPDLATSLGKHNSDFTQWTYTLQPGLKFSTGKPITPMDVKYGIERLFAVDVVNGGPSSYFISGIAHPKNYHGPYQDGDLSTIKTTANSITFNLSGPNADFDYLLAMPAAAPVPYRVEGGPKFKGATYTNHPVASGPFEIHSYQHKKQLTLVRNPYWSQRTDDIRHPLVGKVVLTVDPNLADIDKLLRAGIADARADGGVQTAFQSQILTDPKLKAIADDPVVAATRYIAVIPSVIPNVHCRRAIFYAFDKAAAVRVFGGPTAGVPAIGMTPPGIEGYDPSFNPYPSGPRFTGEIAKAKAELRACDKPNGFTTKFFYATPSETGPYLYRAEQKALGRVGIKITFVPGDADPYGCTYASPALLRRAGVGLLSRSLSAEYPTGSAFYHHVDPGTCLEDQDTNLKRLHNSTVNRILHAAARGRATDADWRALGGAVMASATYLPVAWEKTLYYRGPRLTNVTCDNALASGIYDFVNVGVR